MGPYRFKKHKKHNDDFKLIIPIIVTRGQFDFNLFLVWAHNPEDKDGKYVTQVWKAINFYSRILSRKPTILIGDFNSNTIWDHEKNRLGSHSGVVKKLQRKDIHSAYHSHHVQVQGLEAHPTFYLYRHKNKPYHLDYCFVSAPFSHAIHSVEIGDHKTWTKFSDHMPLMVEFDLPAVET
jgi:exodeoxyribonuclease-3